jgi:hypothetical protein
MNYFNQSKNERKLRENYINIKKLNLKQSHIIEMENTFYFNA